MGRLDRVDLARADHDEVLRCRRAEADQDAAAGVGEVGATGDPGGLGPRPDGCPRRSPVVGVPDAAPSGRGIGSGAVSVDGQIPDPTRYPWSIDRLAASHHARPDGDPTVSRADGGFTQGCGPPPAAGAAGSVVVRRFLAGTLGEDAGQGVAQRPAVDPGLEFGVVCRPRPGPSLLGFACT